ncbi:hypothetical protein [Cyclobacterium salsum]|uniref:hypothetical protein n=1 Tax=Cyclobacterium salsum TaxID=2666329 RepID=UPI001390D690|nr:hypothetical protein [Cyclobacterium salsum]
MQNHQITYLGSFDDRVISNQNWNYLNIRTLNEILISQLIFSHNPKILINDGYIVNSPIFRRALLSISKESKEPFHYENSPLFSMIENDYINILSRNDSLFSMVEKMVEQDNRTFVEFKKIKGWEIAVQKLDRDIGEYFIKWPKFDLSQGFIQLMDELLIQNPKDLNLSIDLNSYKSIAENFREIVHKDSNGPRDKWEKIVKSSKHEYELMKIANRAYHYNFAMCLNDDTFEKDNVQVNSIASNLFLDKIVEPLESDCNFRKLNFRIPEKIRIDNRFIRALRSGNDLCHAHNEFIQANLDYIEGGSAEVLENAQKKFKKEIIEFDKKSNPAKNNNGLEVLISLSYGGLGGIGSTIATGEPILGVLIGVLTALGGATNKGIKLLKGLYKYKGRGYNLIYNRDKASIDNFTIDGAKSKQHTEKLNIFK